MKKTIYPAMTVWAWVIFAAVPCWAGNDINLITGSAKVISVKSPDKIAIGNPEVADVKQISKDELLLTGKTLGSTTLIIWQPDGRKDISTVVVAAGKLAQTMIQVDVQVMEINKTEGDNLGLDWERLVGPTGQLTLKETEAPLKAIGVLERGRLDLLLKLLVEKGNGKILARPKLLTLSGKRAGFSSGGEIPVATSSSTGQTNVEWKKYGVNLDVLPTANDAGTVNAEIRAEVSEVDFTHLVQGNPAIKTRWASTTIFVNPDTTVIIGGLIQEKNQVIYQGLPLLMDIPVLGYLFKSTRIIQEESELVIFVTPHIVGR
jgi:pilus assembly protein CpaC